jgi:hypothetical protein
VLLVLVAAGARAVTTARARGGAIAAATSLILIVALFLIFVAKNLIRCLNCLEYTLCVGTFVGVVLKHKFAVHFLDLWGSGCDGYTESAVQVVTQGR